MSNTITLAMVAVTWVFLAIGWVQTRRIQRRYRELLADYEAGTRYEEGMADVIRELIASAHAAEHVTTIESFRVWADTMDRTARWGADELERLHAEHEEAIR